MPSAGVILRDLSPYLSQFQRKPRKTPNGFDKRNRVLNPEPLVYQFESRTSWTVVEQNTSQSIINKPISQFISDIEKKFFPVELVKI